ncbi:MAG: DUF4190 domain-containing protein [Mycobacterium sp.]|uniref:DUF4190 domain-containing protein n=1 Tax=Mycobacterium sp. TaxID=1785 RepID=UPI003CC6721A
MSHPEQPFNPRPGGQPWQEHSPPPVDPQAPAGYPQHSHGYPALPPVDPQSPVNYPDYSQGYPPPPPVEPQSPAGYFESAPGYPPSPPAFYPPPPYQAGPPGYPNHSGHPGYPGYSGYPDPYDPYRPISTPGTNGLAIGSLVASIGGFPLLFACYTGVAAWIAGIVLGIIALNQIKQTPQEGRGLAIAGIAVGVVGLMVAALAAILLIAAYSTSKTY